MLEVRLSCGALGARRALPALASCQLLLLVALCQSTTLQVNPVPSFPPLCLKVSHGKEAYLATWLSATNEVELALYQGYCKASRCRVPRFCSGWCPGCCCCCCCCLFGLVSCCCLSAPLAGSCRLHQGWGRESESVCLCETQTKPPSHSNFTDSHICHPQ